MGRTIVDVQHLKTLIAVVEQGTFAAAADALALSPSAVSMQIRALEHHLDAELFERTRRPPVLNEMGLALLPTARKIVDLYDGMKDVAGQIEEFTGRLRVGVIPTVLSSFLPKVLADFNADYPGISLEIIRGLSTELMGKMKNDEIDAAIIGKPSRIPVDLVWRQFAREAICIIAPTDAEEETGEELLRKYPFIQLLRGSWQHRLTDRYLAKMGITPRIIMQLESIEATTLMVYHGIGVSIVPQRIVEPILNLPVKKVPFGNPQLYRELGLVHLQGSTRQHLTDVFFNQLSVVEKVQQ